MKARANLPHVIKTGCLFQQLEVGDMRHLLSFFFSYIEDLSDASGRTDGASCQCSGINVASALEVLQYDSSTPRSKVACYWLPLVSCRGTWRDT